MMYQGCGRYEPMPLTRRQMLGRCGMGMGMFGLASLLDSKRVDAATGYGNPMAARKPHFEPRAKRVIHIFLNGGPSHVDTFDPKPALSKHAGKKVPGGNPKTERPTGACLPSPFKFRKYGRSGIDISEIFADLGKCADELCVIRSMHANVPNHEPSLMLMNCGDQTLVRPSVGSWLTYGLGTENQNLPGFVVMCPGGRPITESQNWRSAFLPGVYQGTYVNTRNSDPRKLIANLQNKWMPMDEQHRQIQLLQRLNRKHLQRSGADPALEARIHSFELAYRMQMEATDAFDTNKEPKYIRDMYGKTVQSRQILIARRLIERGVRYVQLYHGAGQPWDNHDDIEKNHRKLAGQCSKAIAALIMDLKQRGMLDDTLVIWGGEFGRTPTVELPKAGANAGKINGRDHNHYGFTVWLAGGGVKGGTIYGATDELGFKAVKDRVHVHDLHATMLHLLGFDHEKLTYRYAGRDFRLTDVAGKLVSGVIA